MLSNQEIEKQVGDRCPSCAIFFDHEHEALILMNAKKNKLEMFFYMVDDKTVHIDPGATMTFKLPKETE